MQKVHFRLTFVAQKRLCSSSLVTVAFVSGCPTKASKKRPPTTGTQFKVCLQLEPVILVKNLETLVCVSPSPMLIWVLQSSLCLKIRVAQHRGRRGAHLSENKGVKSESKKFSRKFKRNGLCFNDLWRVLWPRLVKRWVALSAG